MVECPYCGKKIPHYFIDEVMEGSSGGMHCTNCNRKLRVVARMEQAYDLFPIKGGE